MGKVISPKCSSDFWCGVALSQLYPMQWPLYIYIYIYIYIFNLWCSCWSIGWDPVSYAITIPPLFQNDFHFCFPSHKPSMSMFRSYFFIYFFSFFCRQFIHGGGTMVEETEIEKESNITLFLGWGCAKYPLNLPIHPTRTRPTCPVWVIKLGDLGWAG